MADTTYTKTDGIGTFEISIRNCTRAANELLTSGWNSARIDACTSVFAYVHGHTDELPVVDLLALVREIDAISVKCTYGNYSYTIDSVPSIPNLLSFYEELIEDSDSFTIMAGGDAA